MKFFIFFLYTAHLLTEISAWLMTTPMQSALRSKPKNDATKKVMKLVEMIKFINSAYNSGHNGRYGGFHSKHFSRRFALPALGTKSPPAGLVPKEGGKETQLEPMAETVRYHVIDNPEVLEEYSNKRKEKKNKQRYLMRKKKSPIVIENHSLEAKYFNTDLKLKSNHKNAVLKGGSHNTLNTPVKTNPSFELDVDPELTNIEPIYQPTFEDGDEDDNIKLVSTAEKGNNNPRTHEKNHALPARIYNTNKFEKRISIKARGMKHKVSVHKDNAHKDDLIDTGLNKLESQPHHDNNDQVIKIEENKGFFYKNNNYSVNNEGEKDRKDKQPLQRAGNKNKRKHTTPMHVTSRKHKKISNQESEEGHLIYAPQDRNENHKKKYEKIDNYDTEVKKDKKRNGKGNREKEIDLNNSDFPKYHDGIDKMEYEWNKRHLQYDKNDNLKNDNLKNDNLKNDNLKNDNLKNDNLKNDNQRENNDDEWTKKRDDNIKKENDRNKRDKKLNERESTDSDIEKEDASYLRKEGYIP